MFASPTPAEGSVVKVRQRHYLVNEVTAPRFEGESTLVRLSCLDDDAPGEALEVLWDLEVDAEVLPEESTLLEASGRLDEPRMFSAYLHALRWNCVTSTDKRLLQSPFRAGIDLKAYQLEPIRKALELPRVNLFIADDVGLGKTIEAGLVLQELILRQRVDRVLVICPPAVSLQWQEELDQRFGLSFAVYDRDYVSARRRERGFGVNPWTTHTRFIVSYAMLRGTRSKKGRGAQHLELLLSALGDKAPRTLLILDECHQVAPAGGSLYPVDSRTTAAVRQIAERMEHRLFLSATPHNGHSQSFASLLHLLDPQRFTRGVPVQSAAELAPVMVRRLKRHLRAHVDGLPERVLVDHEVALTPDSPEVRLGELLAEYDELYRACLAELPRRQQVARGLVVVNLHKRLLSSIEAFHHTLQLHARGASRSLAELRQRALPIAPDRGDDERDEEELDAEDDAFTEAVSFDAGARARALLDEMLRLSARHRSEPDGRVRALADWINRELCPGGRFNQRRLVLFTEYEHTLSWLRRALPPLLDAGCDGRIERFTGRLSDDNREALKAAFNSPPESHPLRILLCTDAAREGINLQAHCADLFHFDLPWNPSRIEQRNGRIDRVLQPSEQVRCHYFVLPDRPEDRVLAYVVKKLQVIREELGSLSEVISARLAARLEAGLREVSPGDIDRLARPEEAALQASRELEGEGAEALRGDLETLRRQLDTSAKQLAYRPEQLRDVVDLGLTLDAGGGLIPADPPTTPPTWTLPELDSTWRGVLQPMRERPPADAPPWHVPPVRPVAFRAAHQLDAEAVQLHLGHPLVQRILARYRAQGFAAHDLSRVTVIEHSRDHLRRVVAFGRLSLFGHGATRLHETLLAVSARWTEEGVFPFAEAAERRAVENLYDLLAEGPPLHPSPTVQRQVRAHAERDFRALWGHLGAQAEEDEGKARAQLAARGQQEADAMAALLTRQRAAILATFKEATQLKLGLDMAAQEEREQFERDRRYMEKRLEAIDEELVREPAAIRRGYEVVLRRFEPVGVVYLWPVSG